jgi:hypothetical protein
MRVGGVLALGRPARPSLNQVDDAIEHPVDRKRITAFPVALLA